MEVDSYDVLILSDLHLGSKISRANDALHVLKELDYRRLILLGDIFCDLNFRRLDKEHWRFLSYIRKLSNPKRSVEVVWIEGNHDFGLSDVMSHLVGIPVYQEYLWESSGIRNLAIHGHQFDRLIFRNNSMLNRFISNLYLNIQKIEPKKVYLTRILDRLGARWQRLTPRIAKRAVLYGQAHGASRVFCGHTHEPTRVVRDGSEYYNSGSWTGDRPTFITLRDREVEIHEYSERIDGSDSGEERGDAAAPAVGFA
ncbi:MAG: UDP-2,3-diacylglucosamine diphosphatase [Acidobacteria bacterium]|nr:UDP-2,3-diacylglucosamine diphosphatase [Acidobacteriota bacterium]